MWTMLPFFNRGLDISFRSGYCSQCCVVLHWRYSTWRYFIGSLFDVWHCVLPHFVAVVLCFALLRYTLLHNNTGVVSRALLGHCTCRPLCFILLSAVRRRFVVLLLLLLVRTHILHLKCIWETGISSNMVCPCVIVKGPQDRFSPPAGDLFQPKLEKFWFFQTRDVWISFFFALFSSTWSGRGCGNGKKMMSHTCTSQASATFGSESDYSWWVACSLSVKSGQITPTQSWWHGWDEYFDSS